MIVFDTEDNSSELLAAGKSGFDKKVTRIAAITDSGKRFHNRGDVKQFLKWCHEQKTQDVWAFNTQYDIGNLCNSGQIKLDDFDMTLVKGRFIRAKTMGLDFFDVHNLSGGGSSVKSLGKAVGLEKLDSGKLGFDNLDYVFRDCEIPMRWLKFVRERCDDFDIKKIPATLGGLCTKAFASLGYENWFDSSEDSASALTGARVELFSGGGRGRIAYVDINSLYPWAMTQLFPTCIERLGKLEGYGIARVNIEIPKTQLAPLPVKDDENRLIFPCGKLSGVWTIAEIKNAVRCGAKIRKIFWILGSRDGKAYYRDYITTMYQNRLASKSEAESLFWKLLMNNLYGRLAIGGIISRSLKLTEENKNDGLPYGTKILADYEMPLPEFTNYLHAAHVLSYGRLRLFHFLSKIAAEDLIYCDTDSIIFFCRGNPPFPVNKNLGEMKLESWGSRCTPYLPKTYIFDDAYKAKGVPKSRAKDFIVHGRAEYDLPFKMREAIHFYDADNSRKLSVWRKVEKIRAAKYDRKEISGNYFLPKMVKMF
jgi:hypothetical protein